MDSERWKKLESIMLSALELEGVARTEYLDEACVDDHELRREVESMLSANQVEGALQVEQRLLAEADDSGDNEDRLLDTFIGPYRLEARVGRGGMGDVYRAHREDPYHQVVALKLIRSGVVSTETSSRFRTEQQVLAQLVHPNITQLLDGGITADGRPYLVMPFVEGVPITTYCDQHRLSVDQRLDLFRTVCDAVQHAHQNLIVHRDLKPSNILVTEEGDVTLLDFGIAKLLDPQHVGGVVDETVSQIRLMTPEYAAPEQVRGEAITTATDVYALGVLLYELLAGQRPYELKSRLQKEIDRVICEEEPARPSTVVSRSPATGSARGTASSRLRRTLEGDLDNIVMMALRKEPERRYVSSDQLASDIDRYQNGHTVSARKDTAVYRISKFVRRNRAAVFAGCALLILSLAYAVTIARQTIVIADERDRAQVQAEKSEELTQFLLGIFDAADPNNSQGEEISARELLDRAVEGIDEDLADQDELRGHVLQEMGRVYRRMGVLDESQRLLEESLRLRKQLHGEHHEDVAATTVRLGETLTDVGDLSGADSLLSVGLAIQRSILGSGHISVGITLNDIGVVKYYTGELEEADAAFTESLQIKKKEIEEDDVRLVSALSALGVIKLGKKDLVLAESLLVEAVDMADRLGIRKDMTATAARSNLANLYLRRKEYDRAIPVSREVLAIRREVFGNEHQSVATSLNNLATMLSESGNPTEAEPLMREAVEIQRTIGGPLVGRALAGLGVVLLRQERYAEAEAALQEGLEILTKELGAENRQVKIHHRKMANLYKEWGKPDLEERHRNMGAG